MRALVRFRAATDQIAASSDWEWGMYCLSEAVHLYPHVGGSASVAYSDLLRRAFKRVSRLVSGTLQDEAPDLSTEAQRTLRSIARDLGLFDAALLRRSKMVSLRRLRSDVDEPYLHLVHAWRCIAHAPEPEQSDIRCFLEALRAVDLVRLGNRVRAEFGNQFASEPFPALSLTTQGVKEANALVSIKKRVASAPALNQYAESLLHLIRFPLQAPLQITAPQDRSSEQTRPHESVTPGAGNQNLPAIGRERTRSATQKVAYRNHGRWRN